MIDSIKVVLSVCEKIANKHNLKAQIQKCKFGPPIKPFSPLFFMFGGSFIVLYLTFALLLERFGFALPVIGFLGYYIIKKLGKNEQNVLPEGLLDSNVKSVENIFKELSTSQKIELASAVSEVIKKHSSITTLDETAILEAIDPMTELFIVNEIVQLLRERLNADVFLSL